MGVRYCPTLRAGTDGGGSGRKDEMEHGEVGRENKHSRMGIASFVISILVAVTILALVVGGPLLISSSEGFDPQSFDPADPQSIDPSDPAIIAIQILGLGFIVGVLSSFVGLGLGIAGMVQRRRKRLFAVIGAVLNGLVVLGVIALVVLSIGLAGSG